MNDMKDKVGARVVGDNRPDDNRQMLRIRVGNAEREGYAIGIANAFVAKESVEAIAALSPNRRRLL